MKMNFQRLVSAILQEDFDECLRALGMTDNEISEIKLRKTCGHPSPDEQLYVNIPITTEGETLTAGEAFKLEGIEITRPSFVRIGDPIDAYYTAKRTGLPCIYDIYTLKRPWCVDGLDELIFVFEAVLPNGRLVRWATPTLVECSRNREEGIL